MGREVRMVPPNWDRPQQEGKYDGRLQPMHDQRFHEVFAEWLGNFDRIRRGDLTELERECYPAGLADWLTGEGSPPDQKYYRPWRDEEATWFQVWETVSEGTPVTPPFATREELIDYLSTYGDFWDQKRGDGAWKREAATKFVNAGWAPTMIVDASGIHMARDGT